MDLLKIVEQEQMKTDIPPFKPGDTVRVHVKVVEGTRERIQVFEGLVIKRKVEDFGKLLLFAVSHMV